MKGSCNENQRGDLPGMKSNRIARLVAWLRQTRASLSATFRRDNLRRSFHSVWKDKKAYLYFFVAVLVIGAGFSVIGLYADAELSHIRDTVEANYDYHIEISGLSNEDMTAISNRIAMEKTRGTDLLGKVTEKRESDGSYTFLITVPKSGDQEDTMSFVRTELVRKTGAHGKIQTSPLYDFDQDYNLPIQFFRWGATIVWLVISILLLIRLYRIRLEHFRFVYGIYTACGADYPMLFGTAAGEMMAVGGLCFIPSVLIGLGVSALLLFPQGVGLSLSVQTVITLPLILLLTIFLAVRRPMRQLSRQTPVYLLTGQDVSGLVKSPRSSRAIFGKSFPRKYELYGFIRLRRYYAGLIGSAVLFAALFVSGLYIADMQEYREGRPNYEYIITYDATANGETETDNAGNPIELKVPADKAKDIWMDGDFLIPAVNKVSNVAYAWWDADRSASRCESHLLIRPDQTGAISGDYTVPSKECASQGYTLAAQNYTYVAIDEAWVKMMTENGLATIEGDPTPAYSDPYQIIVSEDIYNQSAFNFSPGDKIMIATVSKRRGSIDATMDAKDLLSQQIEKYKFTYEEYTICAVLHDMASEDTVVVGVNYNAYATLAARAAVRDTLYVYMEDGADFEAVRAAESDIRRELSLGWSVTRTGNFFHNTVQADRNIAGLLRVLSILLLAVSPLLWFFSQIMFYRKRREEFTLLRALGATQRQVSRLFPLAGGILSMLAFLVTAVVVWLTSGVVYIGAAILLPSLGITESFSYEYSFSGTTLLLCAGVSILCGFLSCIVSGWLLRREERPEREGTRAKPASAPTFVAGTAADPAAEAAAITPKGDQDHE